MDRMGIRVEPFSTYLERRRKAPFDPDTGDVTPQPLARQTEIVLDQMKRCLEAAGSFDIEVDCIGVV